ncbi:MAG: extracellular solute-binding protein [Pseudomonadota bacterium]|uniref:ABC transporter substrate-binding protein n=1 Tax=Marinobacter sp. TaxID=50741 RepID=UPI002E87595F|nr:extracellular solute-binding protein [Pseudomonadota bacterium]
MPVGRCTAALLIIILTLPVLAIAKTVREPLDVVLMVSGGEQRQVYMELLRTFEAQHPHLDVRHREYEQEDYKANIEGWLTGGSQAPDVMFWFAGHLMNDFYSKGLIRPVGDLWQAQNWDTAFPEGIRRVVSFAGQPMGVPIAYYHWGLYYNKALFQRLGLNPPATWDALLEAGKRLKAEGITPVAVGTKAGWTAAAWFDYLNLRLNGLAFHERLMRGEVPFDDDRVRAVFEHWQQLVKGDFFLQGHAGMSWRNALPFLYRGHAGMMLMGGFVKPQFPDSVLDNIGVVRFPLLQSNLGVYENAPTDMFFIPAGADNPEGAETLLAYMGEPETQAWFNHRLGTTAPNLNVTGYQDSIDEQGGKVLAGADGYSQFFDRNTPRTLSNPAMEVFVDFMAGDMDVDRALSRLERLRATVFGSPAEEPLVAE